MEIYVYMCIFANVQLIQQNNQIHTIALYRFVCRSSCLCLTNQLNDEIKSVYSLNVKIPARNVHAPQRQSRMSKMKCVMRFHTNATRIANIFAQVF